MTKRMNPKTITKIPNEKISFLVPAVWVRKFEELRLERQGASGQNVAMTELYCDALKEYLDRIQPKRKKA